ncbi:ATP-dependent zinc metalloprotease FtsH [Rhynchospora pubera]|uniref:ATP-dependent zinc metalloprotease FtsH n=1 Tax=Rhynchospora pubera TaxID=906938 RepID=A0AAV8GWT4_9POAL|nr:ATP-dependent zinc metalloprotease FtsH [Rhynchospora pubera]
MECTAFCTLHANIPSSRKNPPFSFFPHGRRCRLVVPTSSLPSKSKTISIPFSKRSSSISPLKSHSSSEPSNHFHFSSILYHAHKPFAIMLFSIALSLTPHPFSKGYAIAKPAKVTSQNNVKSKKQNSSNEHEFSVYTERLLDCVPILENRIKEVIEEKGDMGLVQEALKEVRKRGNEIQKKILHNLWKELEQLGNEKVQCLTKAEMMLEKVLPVREELGKLVRREKVTAGESKAEVAIKERQRIVELERRLEGLEREYNGLIEKAEDFNQKIEMRERFTISVGMREILFVERECEELVGKLNQSLKQKELDRKLKDKYSKLSREDLKKDLEAAQSSYMEQTLLPKSFSNVDSNSNFSFDAGAQQLATRIKQTLVESKQMQRDLENQIRKQMRVYGEERRYVVKTSESEVVKGFPEFESIWKFGEKEVVNPNAVQLKLFHGWAKWREEERAKLKREVLENEEFGRDYMARIKEKILLDRERVVAKTWYNERRKRWEIEPLVVPYAVSRKLVKTARIKHDWAIMYLSLKGDDKEYYVNIKEYDELLQDFGGFDGLYLELQAIGVPTMVQFMPFQFADFDIREAIFMPLGFMYACLAMLGEIRLGKYIRQWVSPKLPKAIDEFMIIIGFPLIERLIPKKTRMNWGMVWPEDADEVVGDTWYLRWQGQTEYKFRGVTSNLRSVLKLTFRYAIYTLLFVKLILLIGSKLPKFPKFKSVIRGGASMQKFYRLQKYFRYSFLRNKQKIIDGLDPISSAFDHMKRVKNPPIRLENFANIDSMREEINDIVTCLKDPTAFQERGARAPKGVLIVGERGTGKTSLAMAIAAEARVPVVKIEAQNFDAGIWVGQSASNVRELFQTARDLAPVIIFVEDFEIFAGPRGKTMQTKKQDHEALINQLLVELDGFEKQDGVVLMATARNIRKIDEAVRRPGRMDRVLRLQSPTQVERERILLFAAKESMDEELASFVNWKKVAEKTSSLRPSELRHVPIALESHAFRNKFVDPDELLSYCGWFVTFNDNFPHWIRRTKFWKAISKGLVSHLGLALTREDIEAVVDLMEASGSANDGIELANPNAEWSMETKYPHAVWAAGRALIALLLPNFDIVENIWLEPNSWEGIGCTKITKVRIEGLIDGNVESRSYLEKKLVFCFGSHIASKMLVSLSDENLLSSGEVKQAQEIATQMVVEYGWSPDDSPAIYFTSNAVHTLSMGDNHEFDMAAKVQKLYDLGFDKAQEMLQKNYTVLEKIVEELLESNHLTGEDLMHILEKHGGIREKEPFHLLKPNYTELAPRVSRDDIGNGALLNLLSAPIL